jgi:hypothetical protein
LSSTIYTKCHAITLPSAPLNHSYAAYLLDRNSSQGQVVVLSILASSVRALRTLCGMTWQFEAPAPYCYPRYVLENEKLKTIAPPVQSLRELRSSFENSTDWHRVIQKLRSDDAFYNGFLFQHNFFDRSAIVRIIRRAFAQQYQQEKREEVYNETTGFNANVEIPLMEAIVTEFVDTVRQDGKLPVILLFNDKDYSNHLFQALHSLLTRRNIPYISTHTIAPATDLRNFISDGHFTPEIDRRIAQALLSLINQLLDRNPTPNPNP